MIPENGQENEHGRIAGGLGPLFSGLIAATLIALTLLAAVAMGMGEQQMLAQVEPSPTATATPLRATPVPSATSTDMPVPSSTVTPTASAIVTETVTLTPGAITAPTHTRTPTATPTRCKAFPVWGEENVWVVQRGETLYRISLATDTSVDEIKWANCLTSDNIVAGWKLYVRRLPPTPRPTVPPPVIKTFELDPADQVIAGECVQIDWVVQGAVSKVTLLADGMSLVSAGSATGSYSDCPTEAGTRRYTLRAWGPDVSTYRIKSIKVVDDSITPTPTSGTPTLTPTPGSPAPATDTPTPTPSDTPVPPTNTLTNTPVPPTNTPTHTPVPPTNTPTNTPEPEAASPREMASIVEIVRSWAAASLLQAHLPAL